MRVLYLSYDGLTDSLGRSQVLPYILGLEQKGHVFHIISFEKKERYAEDGERIRTLLSGSDIKWEPMMYTSSPPILSTVYDVLRLRAEVTRLHREQPFDIIHCRSYITSLVGLAMKRRMGLPFVFDMRAFYADERVDGGLWNLRNPVFRMVYSFFKRKELEFLQEADHTISLTEKGRDIIHSWDRVGGQPVPIEVIPCCADLAHFSQKNVNDAERDRLRKECGIAENDLVLAYLGSVGTWYMLPEMLGFFKVLLQTRPAARFLFITKDDPQEIIQAATALAIPKNRIFIRPAQREEVPNYLSLAHAAVFFIRPVFSKSGSSPTKHGEMLGMGLPVIANAGVGDVDRIITSTDTGILIDEFTDAEYRRAIAQIDHIGSIPAERMTAAAQKFYSLSEGVERYHAVYEQVGDQ